MFSPTLTEESSDTEKAARSELHHRSALRLRHMCSKNGGLFVKAGQIVGALDYLFPQEYVEVFRLFHSDAPMTPVGQLKLVLVKDLGNDVEELIEHFEPVPLGAASLAQCHKVILKDGRTVAMKIQHPNVKSTCGTDIRTIEFLVNCVSWVFPSFHFDWLVKDMKRNLPKELDFVHEAKNMEKFSKLLAHFTFVKAPNVYWDLTSSSVLTMEYCEGGNINDFDYIKKHNINCRDVTWKLGKLYSEMIFVHGYIHCDPHPGNILIRKGVKDEAEIVMLDHGLYIELTDQFRLTYCRLWQGILNGDTSLVKRYCQALNAGELYPLLASMVSARLWESIENAQVEKGPPSSTEESLIRHYVVIHSPEITQLLGTIPKEMLHILKTNDLIRSLERSLGTRYPAAGFINMSKCCVRVIADDNSTHSSGMISRASVKIKLYYQLFLLRVYELWHSWMNTIAA